MFKPSLTKVNVQEEGLQSTFFYQINPKADLLIAIVQRYHTGIVESWSVQAQVYIWVGGTWWRNTKVGVGNEATCWYGRQNEAMNESTNEWIHKWMKPQMKPHVDMAGRSQYRNSQFRRAFLTLWVITCRKVLRVLNFPNILCYKVSNFSLYGQG
jgi:hypothetical protein